MTALRLRKGRYCHAAVHPYHEHPAHHTRHELIRATVYACENRNDISAKYDYAGSILGLGTRVALLDCQNNGNISVGRNYAGGITGYFRGTIRSSYSIGVLDGTSYIGGIAGIGAFIENCVSIPLIDSDGAYIGGIAGTTSETAQGNLFVSDSLGGIDNISYTRIAESIFYKNLMQQDSISDIFRTLKVHFEVDGETVREDVVPYGEGILSLPPVDRKDGMYWRWDSFDKDRIRINQTVSGEWHNLITTLASAEETPLFLVDGKFDETARLEVNTRAYIPGNDFQVNILACYSLYAADDETQNVTVRYLTETDGDLYLIHEDEKIPTSYSRDGRYIVFEYG